MKLIGLSCLYATIARKSGCLVRNERVETLEDRYLALYKCSCHDRMYYRMYYRMSSFMVCVLKNDGQTTLIEERS